MTWNTLNILLSEIKQGTLEQSAPKWDYEMKGATGRRRGSWIALTSFPSAEFAFGME